MAESAQRLRIRDLLACGRGELFGPGNAQLPLRDLMFDPHQRDFRDRRGIWQGPGSRRTRCEAGLWFFG